MLKLKRPHFLTAALFILTAAVPAITHARTPDAVETADEAMAHLKSDAAAEHKNILLSFGASWCINCRLFDKFLADPAIRPILDRAFVFADLNTGERPGDNRHPNIPGGQKLEASLGGRNAGYPYIVMLDPNGNLIASSIAPSVHGRGGNIGYPASRDEIDWFMDMLKKADPALSTGESATVRNWLITHSPVH